jgi:YHS domain-containing protein
MNVHALASALALTLLACGSAPVAPAADATDAAKASAPSDAKPASTAVYKAPGEAKVGDKSTCLISNEEFLVTDKSPKVEHEGKTYYFCCPGCDTEFKADPAKYLKPKGA